MPRFIMLDTSIVHACDNGTVGYVACVASVVTGSLSRGTHNGPESTENK